MAMADVTRDFQRPNMANSQFEGYVINVDDPDKRQRVRVRVPVLHRGIPDDKLPWANVMSAGQANAGAGVGTVNVPEKNAKVIINFAEDDPHNPQYAFSPASDDVNKDNALNEEDYPNTYGSVDSYGNRFSTNRATGDITISHRSGATVHIDGNGNVSVAAAGDLYLAAKNNIAISAGGKMKLSAGGDITLDGANVLFNSGSADSPNIPGARQPPQIPDHSGQTDL